MFSGGYLMSYYSKDPVTVYGVAIAMDSMDCDTLKIVGLQGTIAKRTGGVMSLLDTAVADSGVNVNRFCFSLVGNGVLYEQYVPLYEFYFDHPIVVSDTFWVGYFRSCDSCYYSYYQTGFYCTLGDSINPSDVCSDPRPGIYHQQGCWVPFVPMAPRPGWFPILQPCPPPELRLDNVDDLTKVFSWDGDVQDTFQLAVSEYQHPADSGTLYNLSDTTITLFNGLRETMLAARVRVKCTPNEAKCPSVNYWSPWSEPVLFYFGSVAPDTTHFDTTQIDTTHIDTTHIDTTNIGLQQVENDDIDITLTPNPTTERVTVSAMGMQSVELLAVDGTVILHHEGLHQDEYHLALKGLAAGLYMVRVSTPLGTATRRLLVQ